MQIFDRRLLRRRRDRAAKTASRYDFLLRLSASRLTERLDMVKRDFPVMLDLGSANGILADALMQRPGTKNIIRCDFSWPLLASNTSTMPAVVMDEENLPFARNSLDAVVSNLNLHWVNDLPGALLQIKNALRPDGLFLCAVLGGETLFELRQSLMQAEMNVMGGASPRVSPLIDLRDMGSLMQRAGFSLPVVDSERITVDYATPFSLMHDLRGMGAANATVNRLKKPTRRAVIMEAARLYQQEHTDKNGRVSATFDVLFAIGWSPHASQQKPLVPGSAKTRLAEVLETSEIKI